VVDLAAIHLRSRYRELAKALGDDALEELGELLRAILAEAKKESEKQARRAASR
jgi:hypothetical protein